MNLVFIIRNFNKIKKNAVLWGFDKRTKINIEVKTVNVGPDFIIEKHKLS